MTPKPHSCHDHGHVWLETDGTPYTRHRGRTQANVDVACQYCPAIRSAPTFAAHTAPPQQMPPRVRDFPDRPKKKKRSTGPVPKRT